VRQQLPEHGPSARVEWHLEPKVEVVLGMIRALTRQGKPLGLGSGRVDLDLGDGLKRRAIHGNLQSP
jgi:hypothetical protein